MWFDERMHYPQLYCPAIHRWEIALKQMLLAAACILNNKTYFVRRYNKTRGRLTFTTCISWRIWDTIILRSTFVTFKKPIWNYNTAEGRNRDSLNEVPTDAIWTIWQPQIEYSIQYKFAWQFKNKAVELKLRTIARAAGKHPEIMLDSFGDPHTQSLK